MTDTTLSPKTSLKSLFVPVVFGNGMDDDTPGLVAVFANEPVMINNTIFYADEDIVLDSLELVINRRLEVHNFLGEPIVCFGTYWPADTALVVRLPDTQVVPYRHVQLSNNDIHLRGDYYR